MTGHGAYSAVRRTMAGLIFLTVALAAKGAFAAWQTDDAALLGVGGIASFAFAAAIHFCARLVQERIRGAELQKNRV